MAKEGYMMVMSYDWFFLQRWSRALFKLKGGYLEYISEEVRDKVDLSTVHTFKNADDGITGFCTEEHVTMMELRTRDRVLYFHAYTEREKNEWMSAISRAIMRTYAMGFGDSDDFDYDADIQTARWERRKAFLLVVEDMVRRLKRIGFLGERIASNELEYSRQLDYRIRKKEIESSLPPSSLLEVFTVGDKDIVKCIATFL